jgi:capsular polysaccharide biosynthesis protein
VIYSELYRVLWRRKALVAAGTLLCVALAFAVAQSRPKLYTATATVRMEPLGVMSANDRFEASQRLAQTYAEIYTQGAVIPEMNRALGGATPVRRKELAAEQVKDLGLLAIKGIATDPTRATAIARAGRVALESFSKRETLAPIALDVPTSPSSPNIKMDVILALVGGFVLSAGLTLALNALQQPIGGADDLEREHGLPVLATVPRLRLSQRRTSARGGTRPSPAPREVLVSDAAADGARRIADSRPSRGRA